MTKREQAQPQQIEGTLVRVLQPKLTDVHSSTLRVFLCGDQPGIQDHVRGLMNEEAIAVEARKLLSSGEATEALRSIAEKASEADRTDRQLLREVQQLQLQRDAALDTPKPDEASLKRVHDLDVQLQELNSRRETIATALAELRARADAVAGDLRNTIRAAVEQAGDELRVEAHRRAETAWQQLPASLQAARQQFGEYLVAEGLAYHVGVVAPSAQRQLFKELGVPVPDTSVGPVPPEAEKAKNLAEEAIAFMEARSRARACSAAVAGTIGPDAGRRGA